MNKSIATDQKSELLDMMESLQNEVLALKALSSLLCGCSTANSVEPSDLTYLLDPIIERETSLIDDAFKLLNRPNR